MLYSFDPPNKPMNAQTATCSGCQDMYSWVTGNVTPPDALALRTLDQSIPIGLCLLLDILHERPRFILPREVRAGVGKTVSVLYSRWILTQDDH